MLFINNFRYFIIESIGHFINRDCYRSYNVTFSLIIKSYPMMICHYFVFGVIETYRIIFYPVVGILIKWFHTREVLHIVTIAIRFMISS